MSEPKTYKIWAELEVIRDASVTVFFDDVEDAIDELCDAMENRVCIRPTGRWKQL